VPEWVGTQAGLLRSGGEDGGRGYVCVCVCVCVCVGGGEDWKGLVWRRV